MERCDFASIAAILRENLMDGSFANQVEFASALFEGFVQETEFDFDNGSLNKWFNGLVKVSPVIGQYYHDDPEHRRELAETLRKRILTCMADSTMAVREVHALLLQDESVSDEKKANLCGRLCSEGGDYAAFLADVLVFGIVRRPFVARDIRKTSQSLSDVKPSLFCVQSSGDGRPCSFHCGNSHEDSRELDVFSRGGPDNLLNGSGAGLCESIMRIVWEVAHQQGWADFERGLFLLYDMEQMFMRDGNHALLGALAKLLQTMSSLQSSVEDSVQAQQQYTKVLYIRRVAMDDLQFRRKRAIRAGYYDYAESKTSRGPPLRKCAATLVYQFHRAVSGERRTACTPQFLVNLRSISAQ